MRKIWTSLVLTLSSCLISNCAHAEDGKMVFAIDIIRHGDRSPVVGIPSAPHKWPQGFGQLSPEGMAQEFKLGTELRERYVTTNHLLPPSYLAETVHIQSSDVDRTLMSAECVLMGLYPLGQGPLDEEGKAAIPSRYQPIPIHTKPRDEDATLVPDSNHALPAIYDQYAYGSPVWKDYTATVQPQFAHWSELSGMKLSTLRQVGGLADTIHIYEIHHVPLPAAMSQEEAAAIMKAGEWAFAQTFKPPEVGACAGGALLTEVANYLKQASAQKTKLKFVLFSSHDSTIASIMSAMHVPLDQRPPYASDLNIALFEAGKDYTVKVTFNDKPVVLPGGSASGCTLAQFEALANSGK